MSGLPIGGRTPWPPKVWEPTYQRYAEWSAWYSGDQVQLAHVYSGLVAPPNLQSWNDSRPIANQLLSVLNRFWTRQRTTPATRVRMHHPLASDVAVKSADLLFSEPPDFVIPAAHDEKAPQDAKDLQDYINDAVADLNLHSMLLEAAEVSAALSGIFLRVTWDTDIADHPIITAVHPDAAIPEFSWGKLQAVTFWRIVQTEQSAPFTPPGYPGVTAPDDAGRVGKVYRHLERHEKGRILHGLYEGTAKELGRLVPLTETPATSGLADSVNENSEIPTGIDLLTAVYVPNMRPNRADRASDLGRSDYQGCEPLFDALDETWTSWMRDIRLARARIIVPQEYLDNLGRGQGSIFDTEREIFTPIEGVDPKDSAYSIELIQPGIRFQEHMTTAMRLIEDIVTTSGYSQATFGLQGAERVQPQTATEVEARERASFVTRNKKVRYWTPGLRDIMAAYLAIDKAVFGGPGLPDTEGYELRVDFSDSVQDSLDRTSQTIVALRQAEAASTKTLVMLAHPDWSPEEVDAEVDLIMGERGSMVTDPTMNPGQPGQPAPVSGDDTGADPAPTAES